MHKALGRAGKAVFVIAAAWIILSFFRVFLESSTPEHVVVGAVILLLLSAFFYLAFSRKRV